MGNNRAFTAFEATVIATYDKGVLDEELLSSFMEQWRGSDIDSGGKRGLATKDGLEVEDVVLKVFGVEMPPKPDGDDCEDWYELQYERFSEISRQRFGWE